VDGTAHAVVEFGVELWQSVPYKSKPKLKTKRHK